MSAEGKVIITQKMLAVLLVTVITMHCPSNCLYCINSYKLSNEAYITFVTYSESNFKSILYMVQNHKSNFKFDVNLFLPSILICSCVSISASFMSLCYP